MFSLENRDIFSVNLYDNFLLFYWLLSLEFLSRTNPKIMVLNRTTLISLVTNTTLTAAFKLLSRKHRNKLVVPVSESCGEFGAIPQAHTHPQDTLKCTHLRPPAPPLRTIALIVTAHP